MGTQTRIQTEPAMIRTKFKPKFIKIRINQLNLNGYMNVHPNKKTI